jgi:hypothetical protein
MGQAGAAFTPEEITALGSDPTHSAAIDSLFTPAKPHEYQMPGHGDYDPKQRAADMQIRTWLSTAKFPRDIGSSLAAEASRVLQQHAGMNETEKELFKRTEAVKLENLLGSKFGERVALARQLLTELDATPQGKGILDWVDQSGLGNSAMVINLVAAQAERLAARSTKAKG